MASYWIKTRVARNGDIRHIIGYRLGGRGSREFHAGTVGSRSEAEKILTSIREQVAAGRFVNRDPLTGRPKLVYFARLGDLIKIGISVAPEKRARALNADLLHVERGGRERERQLHEAFRHARLSGEWFTDDVRIRRYLENRAGKPEAMQPNEERDH